MVLNLFSGTQSISSQIFRNYDRIKQINIIVGSAQLENWHPMAQKIITNLAGKHFSMKAFKAGKLVVFGAPKEIRNIKNILEKKTDTQVSDFVRREAHQVLIKLTKLLLLIHKLLKSIFLSNNSLTEEP